MRCHFGKGFKNGIAGWWFSQDDIDRVYREPSDILMLDMEFGTQCRLNCGYCFRKDDHREDNRRSSGPLTKEDVFSIVEQAEKMHAQSIHFVGKGEPLEEEDFLPIVHKIADSGMIPLIFTAGHVLGDERLAVRIHKMKCIDIVEDLYNSKASIILKINSLNSRIQNRVVATQKIKYENEKMRPFNYTRARDYALELLMKAGFNSSKHNPTRLGTATVMLKSNYDELFHHYRYFRSLNIYPIINTVVPCGRTHDLEEVRKISPSQREKFELWSRIYEFNIDNGIKYEGISSYVGGHICSQLGYAMYINVYGEVFDCPSSTHQIGNVKTNGVPAKTLSEIWGNRSKTNPYRGCRDNGCPWRLDPTMIPPTLFRKVHEYLMKRYPHNKEIKNFVPPKYYGN